MAIKSLKELERKKRATAKQVEKAKKTKAIKDVKTKVVGKTQGRTEVSLGRQRKEDVAGVVKGFRQRVKADMGAIIKDKDGNIIARTHIAQGKTTLPEQLIIKALSKYGKKFDEVVVIMTVQARGAKRNVKRRKAK